MPADKLAGGTPVARKANERWTVLVVEDEELVLMALTDELTERGLNALDARDAAEALTILEGGAPVDLLITDIGLPGLDGRRLAERAQRLRPALKVLFLTGYLIDPGEIPPGSRFVEKPIELDLLARMAEATLEEVDDQLV
jgi:CheY-like chemotaxis protein